MNKLPIIAMILASLYQGISQTSTAFAFVALVAIAFAAGLFKEFNAPRVTFASDPVSAVNTRQKTTKKEQELLFYSSVDYERFEYDDVDCLQAYQELQWEWEWERDITSLVSIQSAARMFYSKHTLQKLKKVTASTKLQSAWRASVQFNKFIKVVSGIQVIQSSIRVLCATRRRLVERNENVAASKLQGKWRSVLCVNIILLTRFEITRLQAYIRGSLVRIQFAKSKSQACVAVLQSSLRRVTFAEDVVSAIFIIPAHNIPVCIEVVQCPFAPQKAVVQCGRLTSLPAPRAIDFVQCPFAPRKVTQCRPLKPLILLSAPIAFDFHDDPMDIDVMEPPIFAADIMPDIEFRDELIVDELALQPAPFAAVDPPVSKAPVVSDEQSSTAFEQIVTGMMADAGDEVALLEVAPIAAEAEEYSVPIIVSPNPSTEEPAESPLRRRSERLAAKRAAARNMVPSIPLPRHTTSLPRGRRSQEAPRRQSDRLAAKERVCYKAFL